MFTVRAGTADDLERMYQLDVLCFAPVFRFSRAAMHRFSYGRNKRTLIAEDERGAMAGFLILSLHPKYDFAYITTLDVDPLQRRRGVARKLLEAAERIAVDDPVSAMLLHVHTENQEAVQLYEACGYVQQSCEENFYGDGLDAFVLLKSL